MQLHPDARHGQSVDAAGDAGSVAIRADELRKRFVVKSWIPGRPITAVDALRGATLTVRRGTIHGVMGRNGSGKSTLLRILATLVIADGGHAAVEGHDVEREEKDVRRAIGFSTGEERSLYWRLTARQNLEFAAALYRLPRPEVAIDQAVEMVGLTRAADRPVSGFSQGMSRRLGLARALLHQPRVLLLDEPTRSLDPAARTEFQSVLAGLREERGVTTLLTTHDLDEAVAICDEVSVLRDGRFVDHLDELDHDALSTSLEDGER